MIKQHEEYFFRVVFLYKGGRFYGEKLPGSRRV